MSATPEQHERRLEEKWTDDMRAIVEEFADWMEEEQVSQRAAARRLGISPSAMSQMLQEEYDGDAPGIADKMDRLLERHRMRQLVPDRPDFVRTSVSDQVHEACTIAHVERVIENVRGKCVVTSDHGQMFGERLFPIPVRAYGHPLGLYSEELVKVPWHIFEDGSRREITAEKRSGTTDAETNEELARERLRDLGYLAS